MSSIFQRWRSRSPTIASHSSGSTSEMGAQAMREVEDSVTARPVYRSAHGRCDVIRRDRALAQDAWRDRVIRAVDDARGRAATNRAVVDDERENVAERPLDEVCGGGVRLAGDVRRACRKRSQPTSQRARNLVVGQSQAERRAAAAEQRGQIDVRAPFEDERQSAGPEALRELFGGTGDDGKATDLLERVDEQLDALLGRALLCLD